MCLTTGRYHRSFASVLLVNALSGLGFLGTGADGGITAGDRDQY